MRRFYNVPEKIGRITVVGDGPVSGPRGVAKIAYAANHDWYLDGDLGFASPPKPQSS